MDILRYFTFRTMVLLFSTTFSIMFVMLMLNIVTADDLITIFNLSSESATALKRIISHFKEVSGNIVDILSQLLNKLFGWAGIDVDLSKIKVDLNELPESGPDVAP
jgi:hypothetical protein